MKSLMASRARDSTRSEYITAESTACKLTKIAWHYGGGLREKFCLKIVNNLILNRDK